MKCVYLPDLNNTEVQKFIDDIYKGEIATKKDTGVPRGRRWGGAARMIEVDFLSSANILW
jgi:hypothetical protein